MSQDKFISDETVNAFIDNELDADERAQLVTAIQNDKVLQQKVNELRQVKEMLTLAYQDPPSPVIGLTEVTSASALRMGIAASVLVVLGFSLGWWMHVEVAPDPPQSFATVSQLDNEYVLTPKVLLHVSTMDSQRIEVALKKAEHLLAQHRQTNRPLDMEVIVNAQGLGLLRQGSPYAEKVRTLVQEYDNLSFLACGVARENARLKEGGAIELLPEATQVPAALELILKRLKRGWMYVRV